MKMSTNRNLLGRIYLNRYKVEFFIGMGIVVFFSLLATQQSYRVGDGSEYLAMYFSLANNAQPWSSVSSLTAYDKYLVSQEVLGGVNSDVLKSAFPALNTISGQWDFNHFWFYSFLAVTSQFLFTFGTALQSAKIAFLFLHAILTFVLMVVSFRKFGARGLIASILLIASSPVLWFTFAIHTEYFTITLTTLAVVYFLSRDRLPSALCLAIASTQNPSFLIIAAAAVIFELVANWAILRTLRFWLFGLIILCIGLLHPGYYFSRYEAATPQSIAGGLSFGENLEYFYIWFVDPDLGLIPNWPLAALAIFACALILRYGRKATNFSELIRNSRSEIAGFVIVYLVISVFAQSGTTNLNSGATPGVARYALWYVALLFPVFLFVLSHINSKSRTSMNVAAAVAIVFVSLNLLSNSPLKKEDYSTPSALGLYVQKNLSRGYTPPPEVFAERYSGVGEAIWTSEYSAVLGPDCKKVLIIRQTSKPKVANNYSCKVDIPEGLFVQLTSTENHSDSNYFANLEQKNN